MLNSRDCQTPIYSNRNFRPVASTPNLYFTLRCWFARLYDIHGLAIRPCYNRCTFRIPTVSGREESVKRRPSLLLIAFATCCLCMLFFVTPAYAYPDDPNAGGLFSQIITPLVAAAVGFTFYRKPVAAVFAGLSRRLRRRSDV